MLPSKTLAARSEKSASGMMKQKDRASGMKKQKDRASGMKKQKDRVTLLSCANATGMNKLPLLFIGKSKNPRCFKNINKSALPVHYYNQKSAWMDSRFFLDWFHNEFVPAVTTYQKGKGSAVKVLLLLDNTPSHRDASALVSKDGNIKAFPPSQYSCTYSTYGGGDDHG